LSGTLTSTTKSSKTSWSIRRELHRPFPWELAISAPEVKAKQRETAVAVLPDHMAELSRKVESPFIQAITDSLAAKCVFLDGKVMLVGDAVAGLRPRTTAGTNQAVLHVLLLERVFEKGSAMSVVEWEQKILEWSTIAHAVGIKLGNLSQFDEHPMAEKDKGPKI
jgi:hypothetical protein